MLCLLNLRHEKPTDPDDPLADQNIKDRYYGINDPVADKLLKRASTMPRLDPPDDKTITTLYVGGLGDTITESDLRCVGAAVLPLYLMLWLLLIFKGGKNLSCKEKKTKQNWLSVFLNGELVGGQVERSTSLLENR